MIPIPAATWVTIPVNVSPFPKYVRASTVFAVTVCAAATLVAVTSPDTLTLPTTSSFSVGTEDPIPKFPGSGVNANWFSVILNCALPSPSTKVGK